jgi:hypothetical protein
MTRPSGEKSAAIDLQVIETILKDFPAIAGDRLEALARGLTGDLDGVPLAVARDLMDGSRKDLRQRRNAARLTIEFRQAEDPTSVERDDPLLAPRRGIESFLKENPGFRLHSPRPPALPFDADRLSEDPPGGIERLVEEFLAEHPGKRPGLDSHRSGEPLAVEAARRRVSLAAVSQRRRRAVEAFKRWYRARYQAS